MGHAKTSSSRHRVSRAAAVLGLALGAGCLASAQGEPPKPKPAKGEKAPKAKKAKPPQWFARLGKKERPKKLPEGVSYGANPGEYVNQADGSILVWVPPGTFTMGEDEDVFRDRRPVHQVKLTRGYFIGKYEVTWGQYKKFAAAKGYTVGTLPSNKKPTDQHPISRIGWERAHEYCLEYGLRLPTEAEWEYAARGADARLYPWGNEKPTENLARCKTPTTTNHFPKPVGSFPKGASPFGCLDMAGNVSEWVADRSGRDDEGMSRRCLPYKAKAKKLRRNPKGQKKGRHVVRGGAFNSNWRGVKTTHRAVRISVGEEKRGHWLTGFRVAR
jgi:sulfatase modifying factor 1